MQRQLRDAIKSKYGVSNRTSNQVITALAEVEKHRQRASVSIPSRPRPGVQQSEPVQLFQQQAQQSQHAQQGEQMPSIETIVGGLTGGGGLLGLILGLIKKFLGGGASSQSQGNQNVSNILTDLMSGATNPNEAPDLANVLTGLLGGSGAQSGSGGQPDIEGLITSLLSGQTSPRGARSFRRGK